MSNNFPGTARAASKNAPRLELRGCLQQNLQISGVCDLVLGLAGLCLHNCLRHLLAKAWGPVLLVDHLNAMLEDAPRWPRVQLRHLCHGTRRQNLSAAMAAGELKKGAIHATLPR